MAKLDKNNIQDILTLTPMQNGMLFHYLKEPESDLYLEQLCLALSGKIEEKLFEKAWNFVIAANEMLRTAFRWEGLEKPIQIILKEHYLQPEFYDFLGISKKEIEKSLVEVKKSEREKISALQDEVPFRVALCKIEKDRYEMIISNHHILYDGWSNGIILREFFHAYTDFSAAKEPATTTKTKFKEFVKWLQNLDKHRQAEHWKNYLYGFDTQTELSIKKRSERETITVGNFQTRFEKPINDKIEGFVKEHKITAAALFYCSWGLLLQKYNNIDDVVFGTTVSGRPAGIRGIEKMVGLFINTMPLRMQTYTGEKISDLLHRIDDTLKEREAYENTPLVEIREYSALGVQEELFDNIVVIENYPLENALREGETGGLVIDSHSMFENTHYDLTLGVTPADETVLSFDFREELFDRSSMNDLACRFMKIISEIIDNPGRKIQAIELLSIEEKDSILYGFNNTEVCYPRDKTIYELFAEQVERTPDRVALFVGRIGRNGHVCLTYRKLNEQSDRLAHILLEKGVGPDNIVGIMMERSIEMVTGIFGILKAGGAYLPIDPEYPRERIDYMLKDSGANILLGMEEYQKKVIVNCQLLIVNCKLMGPPPASFHHSSFIIHHSNQLAYIIYTSGSTGKPKGVMVQKKGFLNLLRWYIEEFDIVEEDNNLLIAPISFDLSQKNLFSPFLTGGCLTLASPGIPDYRELTKIIHKEHITMINCAPSVFYPLIEANDNTDFTQLHSLRAIILGGEPIRSDKLLPWVNSEFFDCEIINTYGPTECTDIASFYRIPADTFKRKEIIPIGKPIPNVKVYILDKYLRVLPLRILGELCIGGMGLSKGYYNNMLLTQEKFVDTPHLPEKKVYRTGDLTRWLPDGNIEFLGRIDQQVKVRGFRIELEEIEDRLLKHETVKEAVVGAGQYENGEKYLCAYIVPRSIGTDNIPRWREYLQEKLPGYMVPTHFVLLEKIPLTASGKIDRRSLPQPEATAAGEYLAPRDEVEKKLVDIWSEILEIDRKWIGIDANFFELGGHSLKATALVLRIHKNFDVNISLSRVFQLSTIRRLAKSIAGAVIDRFISIGPAEKKEYYALSPAQKRLYILQQMEENRTSYNMFHAVVLKGDLSKETLEGVFRKMIRRYESLRTSFEMIGNKPVQRIHDDVEFEIEYYNLSTDYTDYSDDKEDKIHYSSFIIHHFIHPFDLSIAPLLRAGLIKEADKRHILVLDMHHIAVDGTSVGIFIDEFVKLYSGAQLPPVKLQYKDFSEWQRKWFDSGGLKSREEYWLKQFEGEVPLLNLPFDYERPAVQTFDFDRVVFEVDKELTALIKKLVSETGATLYMVLLAAYCILLAKYGDQEDIVVGTGVVGRTHPDMEQIIGMFVNMLALRSYPRGNKTLGLFLEEMKDSVLAAFENQDYPFDELVKKLNLKREYGRNPLFDTEFTFQDAGASVIEIPGLKVEPYEYENSLLKFDLSLTAFEADGQIHLILGFSPQLFKRTTIEMMAKHFIELLEQFQGNKNTALKELKILVDHSISAAGTAFSRSDYTGFDF